MALFLLGLVRLVEEYPRPSWGTLLLTGLGFGLSIGSRIMAGFGVIDALVAFALLFAIDAYSGGGRTAGQRLGQFMRALIPGALLAYAVMALVWPWGVVNPLNPIKAIEVFSHFFEKPWRELFDGRLLEPTQMPRTYVLTLLGLKLPELLLASGVLGLIGLLAAVVWPRVPPPQRAAYLAVALAAILPVAAAVATRPAMYNGIRHFVFVLPPLAVAGGVATAWVAERALQIGRPVLTTFALLFAVTWAWPMVAMVQLHPYQYVPSSRPVRSCASGSRCGAKPRRQGGSGKSRCAGRTPPRRSHWAMRSSRPGTRPAPISR
jgi:hypothetical protein